VSLLFHPLQNLFFIPLFAEKVKRILAKKQELNFYDIYY